MELSIGILSGGKSRRMGRNKAKLLLDGDTFLNRIASELAGFSEVIISVDSKENYPDLTWNFVEDEQKSIGPLEGIRQILMHIQHEYAFICGTDMPLMKQELAAYLAEIVTEEYDCYIIQSDGRLHPLCGIYSIYTLPAITKQIEAENYRLQDLLREVRTRYISLEDTGCSSDLVKNINTPREYRELEKG